MISATQLRVGTLLKFEGELYRCTYIMHRTPGNKRGFVQAKLRNMDNNKVIDYRFGSDDKIEDLSLDYKKMQFSYAENDGSAFHFMDNENFDQITIGKDVLEESIPFLQENMEILIGFYDHKAVTIQLPQTMDFKVVSCPPDIKGGSVTASYKTAKLSNGLDVGVPGFIKEGDTIRINTADREYLERA